MSPTLLDELKVVCQANAVTGDADRVAEGETVWLAGRPVAADAGLIGLSLGDGQTTLVSEQAVREVVKDEPYYFVRVPIGTTVLVRAEALTTLKGDERSHGCGCTDGKPAGQTTASREAPGGGSGGTGPVIIECPVVCRVQDVCRFYIGRKGLLGRVCIPTIFCRRDCESQPA